MAAQSKPDLVLASVRRLLRVGATANLLNLLHKRHPVDIAEILRALNEHERRAAIDVLAGSDPRLAMQVVAELGVQVRELMQGQTSAGVTQLLENPEGTAGRIMNPRVFALTEEATAADAVKALQRLGGVEMSFYLYVIDDRRHLVGVVSLRRLLLVPPQATLKEIMTTDVISVGVDTDQEEVAKKVSSYHLLAVPVVDDENKLVGTVTV